MNRYANIDCPICEKPLNSDDNPVVVCPDCGAPYHLDCYKNVKHCIFTELHEKNEEWQAPAKEEKYDAHASLRCSRCAAQNPANGIFCEVCGNQLNDETPSPESTNMNMSGKFAPRGMPLNPFTTPFGGVSPDEEIDGIAAKDIAIFVGQNSHYFLPRFKLLMQSKARVINWAAFLFSGFYFLYRKMYGLGVVLILARLILSIPSILIVIATMTSIPTMSTSTIDADMLNNMNMVTGIISAVIRVVCGLFANSIYKKHVYQKIHQIKEQTQQQGNEAYVTALKQKGSVAVKLIMTLLMLYFIGSFVLVFISLFLGV